MNIRDYKDKILELENKIEEYEGIEGRQAEIADEIEKYLYEKANNSLSEDRADEILDRINSIID